MDADVLELVQVLAAVGSFATLCTVLFIAGRVTLARTGQPRAVSVDSRLPVDDPRFARLEQAVDAIAVEVERISEAQRFTTRLLSERVSEPGVEDAVRVAPRRGSRSP